LDFDSVEIEAQQPPRVVALVRWGKKTSAAVLVLAGECKAGEPERRGG